LKLRERFSDDGGATWSTFTIISTVVTTTVPSSGSALDGRIYQYWLRVYQGGIQYWAFSEMYVNSAPTATLLSNYTTLCAGTTVTFTASAGGTNYNFKINGSSSQSGASSTFVTSALANGDNVTVTITNGSGCSNTSLPIAMTVNPKPTVTSITGNPTPGCLGQNASVTIVGLTGTAPWSMEVWTDVLGNPGALYYTVPGTINTPNSTVSVPIPAVGFTTMHPRFTDANGCSNF